MGEAGGCLELVVDIGERLAEQKIVLLDIRGAQCHKERGDTEHSIQENALVLRCALARKMADEGC